MWGTNGCDVVAISRVIVRKIVRKIGRVGDGNGVDGNDGSDGNGVISEVAHMGSGRRAVHMWCRLHCIKETE